MGGWERCATLQRACNAAHRGKISTIWRSALANSAYFSLSSGTLRKRKAYTESQRRRKGRKGSKEGGSDRSHFTHNQAFLPDSTLLSLSQPLPLHTCLWRVHCPWHCPSEPLSLFLSLRYHHTSYRSSPSVRPHATVSHSSQPSLFTARHCYLPTTNTESRFN